MPGRQSTDGDLTAEPESPPALVAVAVGPYDPARDRELMRGRIAWSLIGILGVVILAAIGFAFTHGQAGACAKMPLEEILTPMIGLVGAVTGFYFGEKTK